MPTDAVVTLQATTVMYVAGEKGRPITEQAPLAMAALEAKLPSFKGRKFYGVALGDEYRTCATIVAADDANALPHPTWTLPGGRHVRRRILDYERNLHLIGPTIEELRRRADADPSRPAIEFYRSQRELLVMVPVSE
jgi:hypothetical protein